MKKYEATMLGAIFVFLGLLLVVHHLLICGRLFDIRDILHHEFFEAVLFTAGIVLLLTTMTPNKNVTAH
jgi:hypothetical protein